MGSLSEGRIRLIRGPVLFVFQVVAPAVLQMLEDLGLFSSEGEALVPGQAEAGWGHPSGLFFGAVRR